MLFLAFYFLLFLVLIFQGTQIAGEVKTPLGTLPEEVGQNPVASARWGILLIGVGFFGAAMGLLGFRSSTLRRPSVLFRLGGFGPHPLRAVGDLFRPQG